MRHSLRSLGFDKRWAALISPSEAGYMVGRISFESRGIYHVLLDKGAQTYGELKGILRKPGQDRAAYPVVGDWVLLERVDDRRAKIVRALPRLNALVRREQSRSEADRRASTLQVLAANVDWGLITTSLNQDFNPRRLERYLSLVRDCGAQAALLLTKADLVDDQGAEAMALAREVAGDAPILLLSMPDGLGLKALKALLGKHSTAVLIGSSGVGKSTLVNGLLGREEMDTQAVREKDSRGRHTTVGRHLLPLPGGGALIDSPGLRDLGLVDEASVALSFEDIVALATRCRFSDCRHVSEPGCAVRAALDQGSLGPDRWQSYLKLREETAMAAKKVQLGAVRFERAKGRPIAKAIKSFYKEKGKGKP